MITPYALGDARVFVIALPRYALPESLSNAEAEVVRLVLDGHSTKVIAALRRTSPRTIANQLAMIYRKLGVNSRTELASALATRAGHDA